MSKKIEPGATVRQTSCHPPGAPAWRIGALGTVVTVGPKTALVRFPASKIVDAAHEARVPIDALAVVPVGGPQGRPREARGGWADVLYEVRTSRGWSHEEVGAALGLGKTQVCEIERGAQEAPRPIRRLLLLLRSVEYRKALGRNEGAFELAAAADGDGAKKS